MAEIPTIHNCCPFFFLNDRFCETYAHINALLNLLVSDTMQNNEGFGCGWCGFFEYAIADCCDEPQ